VTRQFLFEVFSSISNWISFSLYFFSFSEDPSSRVRFFFAIRGTRCPVRCMLVYYGQSNFRFWCSTAPVFCPVISTLARSDKGEMSCTREDLCTGPNWWNVVNWTWFHRFDAKIEYETRKIVVWFVPSSHLTLHTLKPKNKDKNYLKPERFVNKLK
jgi:hypothetical protein